MSVKHKSSLIVWISTLLLAFPAFAEVVPPGTDDEVRERLAPVGQLCRAGDDCGTGTGARASTAAVASGGGAKSGADVYNQFCFACHATGASEAPLFADPEAWEPRIAKGMDTMLSTTINGLGLMPPKGTCMACSDAELEAAVEYMVSSAQ